MALYGGQVSRTSPRSYRDGRVTTFLRPFGHEQRVRALGSGAEVVVVARTSFLADRSGDREAVEEESPTRSRGPRRHGSLGIGSNLRFTFDALVLTALGRGLRRGFGFNPSLLHLRLVLRPPRGCSPAF